MRSTAMLSPASPPRRSNAARALATLLTCAGLILAAPIAWAQTDLLSPQAQAGRKIFFDTRLSNPPGTACVSCHDPKLGWSGNNGSKSGVAAGSTPAALGARNSPTLSYIGFVPAFHLKKNEGKNKAVGGLFWDGRADILEQQARGPLFAKGEMNLAGDAELAERLRGAAYAGELRTAYGLGADPSDTQWAATAMLALGAFQRSPEVAPFSSKYDAVRRGQAKLTQEEARGLRLFADRKKGNCIACHVFKRNSKNPADHLFTDFTYDNLGLPRNGAIPANTDSKAFDLGLCGPARKMPKGLSTSVCGAFKVPTLRNAAQRPFYFHNGSFTDLGEVVRFYVERDTHPEKWYPKNARGKLQVFNDLPARHARNVNRDESPYDRKRGQKPRLDAAEIAAVVAFIKTLDDGFGQ